MVEMVEDEHQWERQVERSVYVSVFAIVFESEIKEMRHLAKR